MELHWYDNLICIFTASFGRFYVAKQILIDSAKVFDMKN